MDIPTDILTTIKIIITEIIIQKIIEIVMKRRRIINYMIIQIKTVKDFKKMQDIEDFHTLRTKERIIQKESYRILKKQTTMKNLKINKIIIIKQEIME